MKNPYLHRYWIKFDPENIDWKSPQIVVWRGCGVTAYNADDALMILQKQLLRQNLLPEVLSITEDIDISTLDAKHILPNIGITIHRGIWFPNIGPYTER